MAALRCDLRSCAPNERLVVSGGVGGDAARDSRIRANHALIDALRGLWDMVPDWRFGQLVMNLSREPGGFADTWEWKHGRWYEEITDCAARVSGAEPPPASPWNPIPRLPSVTEMAVEKHLLGRALLLLDDQPKPNLSVNQEYAPPGTNAWVAKAAKLLDDILESAVPVEAEPPPAPSEAALTEPGSRAGVATNRAQEVAAEGRKGERDPVAPDGPGSVSAVPAQAAHKLIVDALQKGQRDDQLLDGRNFDNDFWMDAFAALDALLARVAERPEWREMYYAENQNWTAMYEENRRSVARAERAEAEAERLRAALAEISGRSIYSAYTAGQAVEIDRAALAGGDAAP